MTHVQADDENPNCEETYASLRVAGDALDPDEVSRVLGIQPSLTRRKGEPHGRSGAINSTGVWILSSEGAVQSKRLEVHLRYLLERIEGRAPDLQRYVRQRGLELDVPCFWMSATGQGGPVLSADLLRDLGALGVSLSFGFYSAV
jgi:Domain of unknown function (DUF4279)